MDIVELVASLAGTPLTIVLVYLLVKEQAAHAETRKARDDDNRAWFERVFSLATAFADTIDRVTDRAEKA